VTNITRTGAMLERSAVGPAAFDGLFGGATLAATIDQQGGPEMAELTQLESKLGEVMGLAQAAQEATTKVAKLVDDDEIKATLQRMSDEAKETEERCLQVAEGLDGKKTAVQEQAKETRSEARDMMQTYLGDEADDLDGLEFLNMAEAGELSHVQIVAVLNEKAGNAQIQELIDTVMPIQQRHVEDTRQATLTLAGREDPHETA
jgi:hypothetical protein